MAARPASVQSRQSVQSSADRKSPPPDASPQAFNRQESIQSTASRKSATTPRTAPQPVPQNPQKPLPWAPSTPRRPGGEVLRKAKQDKAMQDLFYRSEYLATLVSNVAGVEASPVQEVRSCLASSQMPHLISTATAVLNSNQALDALRPQTAPTPLRADFSSRPASSVSRFLQKDPLARLQHPWEGLRDCSSDMMNCTATMLREHLLSNQPEPTLRMAREGEDWVLPNPVDTLKVKPVPGVPHSAISGDYAQAEELEITRHADKCRHVARLSEDRDIDWMADSTLHFSRYFWSMTARGIQESLHGRLRRIDGHHELTGTHRFSLMENGTVLVREEGRDPFHSHALVTMDDPVKVLPEGHYFEIQVLSLFRSPGRPDRPKDIDRRHRTEGIVIGMTSTPPDRMKADVHVASDIACSWCVATSGKYYCSPVPTEPPKRPVSQDRIAQPPRWHRRNLQQEQLRCQWPPLPHHDDTVRRKLDWSVAPAEGDSIGILLTPFGGVVVNVNGERQLFLPDAGVPVGRDMYPLVEVYNHVRSIRVLPGASPPK